MIFVYDKVDVGYIVDGSSTYRLSMMAMISTPKLKEGHEMEVDLETGKSEI